MNNEFKIGETLSLPHNLCITPLGLKTTPFKLKDYIITELFLENGYERITLRIGKREHTKYLQTVMELLKLIKSL